ncbi:hypothetical protein [Prevotella sp. MA2016]|nr:hypothetical protein [Prevotella sp. MA2016]
MNEQLREKARRTQSCGLYFYTIIHHPTPITYHPTPITLHPSPYTPSPYR